MFTGNELENKGTTEKEKDRNIRYLSSFVMSIAGSGLTSEKVRQTSNEVNKFALIQARKEKETGEVNGRD